MYIDDTTVLNSS